MERKALVEVEVPAPDEPVTAMMGCFADIEFSLPWEFRYKGMFRVRSSVRPDSTTAQLLRWRASVPQSAADVKKGCRGSPCDQQRETLAGLLGAGRRLDPYQHGPQQNEQHPERLAGLQRLGKERDVDRQQVDQRIAGAE